MELIIFMGIQASGKSSFYQANFADTHLRLSLDMLRTRHREKALYEACIASKTKVVIDNTNPTIADRAKYSYQAKNAHYKIIGYYFASDLAICIARNKARDKVIPTIGVVGTFKKMQLPSYDEGFDKLYFVRLNSGSFEIQDWKND